MKVIYVILTTTVVCCSCKNTVQRETVYEGKDISDLIRISINKSTKVTTLDILTNEKWRLYSGSSVDSIDFSNPIAKHPEPEGQGYNRISLSTCSRHYYQFVTEEGKAMCAEKHLPMAGGYNFRDLGGIKNKDGRFVKWGKIFRSDDLHNLTEEDLDYLASIPLKSIVDFRGKEEQQAAPDKLPASVVNEFKLPIDPGNVLSLMRFSELDSTQLDSVMMRMNVLFVTDTNFIGYYKEFFKLLREEKNLPLLFHCSAGKDRTGMGAALILYALGVDEQTIMEDYLASNVYLSNKYAKEIAIHPNLKSVLTVKREFLQAGLDQIKTTHGSVEKFLETTLEVDIPAFRKQFLY
ncbi:MAG: tyrosine-protein phosphatase [Butyricimonas faecihominis]